MRNGGIGRGWYEDDPNAMQVTEEAREVTEFFTSMLKTKLDEIWEIRRKNKEAQNAIKERIESENVCEKSEN